MRRTLLFAAGLLILPGMVVHYTTLSESAARPPSYCKTYYHSACNNWKIGAWLPAPIEGFEPWRKGVASHIAFTDHFVSGGEPASPDDGTFFVYGSAGPPKGSVLYDDADSIAFYSQGCCAWHSIVLAAGLRRPPVHVQQRSLRNVRTARGIALGQTMDRVESVYGKTAVQTIAHNASLRMLSYYHSFGNTCGQFQNFGFVQNRLVYIELLSGC
jgi:hypothetical protein